MSLSPQVQEHLNDAVSSVRAALWHGSKNERPSTLSSLAKILNEIDLITKQDDALDKIDSLMEDLKSGKFEEDD